MKARALFDVNVLLAISNPLHRGFESLRAWWSDEMDAGWASCPLTQNGFVRVTSQPNYSLPQRLPVALQILRQMTTDPLHRFWSDDISIADTNIFDHKRLEGPGQITDAYLLAIAAKNGGRLVTFDRRMSIETLKTAKPENLLILGG